MFKLKKISKNLKAVTLLEVLIAFFVITIGLTSVLSLYVAYYSASATISKRARAIFLAQEGLEVIRGYRDALLAQGKTFDLDNGNYLVNVFENKSWRIKKISKDESDCFENSYTDGGCRLNLVHKVYIHYLLFPLSKFGRVVKISKNGDSCGEDCYKIESIVIWKEGDAQKNFSLIEYLYDWKR